MKTRTFYLGLPFIFSALKFSICILFDTLQHLHFQYLTNCGSFILCQIFICIFSLFQYMLMLFNDSTAEYKFYINITV